MGWRDATQQILNTLFLLFYHDSLHDSGPNDWLPFLFNQQLSKIGHMILFYLLISFEEIKNSLRSGHRKTLYQKPNT